MPLEQSILTSTKKVLHIAADDTSFDQDILMHINSAFSTLNDAGVGAPGGFVVEDASKNWTDFLPDDADNRAQIGRVKTFVYLHTRLLFDPPGVVHLLNAAKDQLQEQLWRLSVKREEYDWVDPDPASLVVVDGGDPSGP